MADGGGRRVPGLGESRRVNEGLGLGAGSAVAGRELDQRPICGVPTGLLASHVGDAVGLESSASHCLPEEAHMRARPGSGTDGSPAPRPVHSNAVLLAGAGSGTRRRPRRYPRFNVAWPVVVEAGKRFFLLQAVDVSGRGAKVRPTERLSEGSVAQLHFHPPDGSSLDVEAIVWRVDRDGLAFFFTNDHQRRLGTLLAQLAGAPPALWRSTLN